MPHLKEAELIDGIVYIPSPDFYLPGGNSPDMPSPVSYRKHGKPHSWVLGWLVAYSAETPGTGTADNSSVRLDLDTQPQPDAVLLIGPSHGGRVRISPDDSIVGGPELVVEVAYTSASLDLHGKLHAYRRHGVREYMLWRTEERAIDWFVNREGRFERLTVSAEGLLKSEVFPGLWLEPRALLDREVSRVLAVAHQGLASPEHAAFVARLNEAVERIAAAQRPAEPPPEPLQP
jgi:Uma2 family endonuclease